MTTTVPLEGITGPHGEPVLVRRSARRRRTVQAGRRDGAIVIAIPASFSRRQEQEWVGRMLADIERREQCSPARGDEGLTRLATDLNRRHFGGRAEPASIRWTSRQNSRWGSCTPSDRTIRISDRVRPFPEWVLRSVVVHELAHLLEPGHGPAFRELVERYPRTQRAEGFLHGISFAEGWGGDADSAGDADADDGAPADPSERTSA